MGDRRMNIRHATDADANAIWRIIEPTIRAGATYTLDPAMSREAALRYWLGPDKETFVAERDHLLVGTYYIRANQAGGGAHVANCGYMTAAESQGKGVARAMCEHSIAHARERGFKAMQFNFVVSANQRAVRLWHSMGFETVGRLPLAFRLPSGEYVDALVMFRRIG
jgi:ribosomal protein S18 acetylase RimI-like enzyme